uniref:sensor histidine kinase n=1 Tax=uncultured Amaricoccus sp. TaxID=339341 RepID=UPI0026129023
SISHDLRTPLAAILGAAGTLRDFAGDLTEEARGDLLGTIVAEAERLNRFIANLLDMTRLESGAIAPARTPQDLAEVVGSALERAGRVLAGHHVTVDLADDLPMIEIDPVLFEQVLFNLLDNAAKIAPEGSTVRIEVRPTAAGGATIRVLDEGEGIPEGELERIFDKFHRVQKGDRVRAGTGLGLAVCRGFVEAMGGAISAANRSDGPGAVFTVTLPAPPGARAGRAA